MSRLLLPSILLLAVVLAVDAAAPVGLHGQTVRVQPAPRGWVGISYELRQNLAGRVTVTITQVSEGSPAELAGITVGDVLVSLNGQGFQNNFGNVPLRILTGDAVQVVLTRRGRPMRVSIVATPRPLEVMGEASVTLTVTADSIVESMFRAMDSLRLTLVTTSEGGRRVRIVGVPGGMGRSVVVAGEMAEPSSRFSVVSPELGERLSLREVRAPFGFWVFRSEDHDSLRHAMERLNRDIREIRVREAARLPLLVDESGNLRADETDADLVRLGDVLKSYMDRSVALRQAIDRAVREASEPRTAYSYSWQTGRPAAESEEVLGSLFGPLTPYALGQNRVAGAEIVDLRPELADYFEVEGGILIVDVLPGTPAAMAGIQPGDVITHIDRTTIRSLQEFRLGLRRAGESLPITVVRRGTAIQLLLHR